VTAMVQRLPYAGNVFGGRHYEIRNAAARDVMIKKCGRWNAREPRELRDSSGGAATAWFTDPNNTEAWKRIPRRVQPLAVDVAAELMAAGVTDPKRFAARMRTRLRDRRPDRRSLRRGRDVEGRSIYEVSDEYVNTNGSTGLLSDWAAFAQWQSPEGDDAPEAAEPAPSEIYLRQVAALRAMFVEELFSFWMTPAAGDEKPWARWAAQLLGLRRQHTANAFERALVSPDTVSVREFLELVGRRMNETPPQRRGRKPTATPLSAEAERLEQAEAQIGKLCRLCGVPYPDKQIEATAAREKRAWRAAVKADPELSALLESAA